MTLQWMAVSFFLYSEIVITLFLIIPLLKPSMWKRIFNISVFSTIKPVWTTSFYALLVILIFLFADSIRQMRKYGQPDENMLASFDSKMDRLFKECRGQRNFYITGFALFLMLVIKRLVSIISDHASLNANYEAILKQASNANAELSRRLENEHNDENRATNTKEQYESLQNELKKSQSDLDTLKKQAKATNAEYDRLSSELQKLQRSNSQETKKEQ